MTVLEKANQKRDAAERGMSYGLPGYDRSTLQWWTAYIEGAEDQKREDEASVGSLIEKYRAEATRNAKGAKEPTEEEVAVWVHRHGYVLVDCGIYAMLKASYGREPKRGKWIKTETAGIEETVCSNCRYSGFENMEYCPRCGADMEVTHVH